MDVYDLPDEVPFGEPDYANYDTKVEDAREEAHKTSLKDWLVSQGWSGPNTGREYTTPMGDGHARYLFGDGAGAKNSILIHLPYGDAWHGRDLEFIPEAEIVKRMDASDGLAAFFAKRTA
jgi:hypothetical protein